MMNMTTECNTCHGGTGQPKPCTCASTQMNNDLSRVTCMAEECGAVISGNVFREEVAEPTDGVIMSNAQLLAYTQKVEQDVLAKRDEELSKQLANTTKLWDKSCDELAIAKKEIELLQAKLTMLREIARDAEMWYSRDTVLGKELRMHAHNALNATQADVDNWMQGKKAEWEKGVLEEVITIADAERLRLSEDYKERIDNGTSTMDGNCDWAKLTGAVSVVEVLRRMAKERGGVKGVNAKVAEVTAKVSIVSVIVNQLRRYLEKRGKNFSTRILRSNSASPNWK